jgi:hypothetical protein
MLAMVPTYVVTRPRRRTGTPSQEAHMVATRRTAAAQLASSRATRAVAGYLGLILLILAAILLSTVVSAGVGIPIFVSGCGGYVYYIRGGRIRRKRR